MARTKYRTWVFSLTWRGSTYSAKPQIPPEDVTRFYFIGKFILFCILADLKDERTLNPETAQEIGRSYFSLIISISEDSVEN